MRHCEPPAAKNTSRNFCGTRSRVLLGLALSTSTLFCFPAKANVKGLSRANCLGFVNESITYDRPGLRPFWGSVTSVHRPWGAVTFHELSDPILSDADDLIPRWRFYAGDVGDAATVTVTGTHAWIVTDDKTGEIVEFGGETTIASDCNLMEW